MTAVEEAQRLCSVIQDQPSRFAAAKACLDVNYAYPSLLVVGPLSLHEAADDIATEFREAGLLIAEKGEDPPSLAGVMRGELLAQMMLALGYATTEEAWSLYPDLDEEETDQPRTSEESEQ